MRTAPIRSHRLRPAFRPTAAAGLAALLAVLLAACASDPAQEPTARPAIVTQPGGNGARVELFPGVVRARYASPLGFRIPGKLAARHVDVGQRVEKGALLAELDAGDVGLQVEATRAQMVAAQADLALAAAERDRHRALLERQLVARALFDTRQAQYEAAAARVEQLQAQLEVSRNQAGYAALRAGHAGIVTALQAEVGQVLAAGQPVLVLAREDALEVAISLPEQRRAQFAAGDAAAVELWAQEGERIAGTVREIAPQADPLTRTYDARVAFSVDDAEAWLGQTARVYFVRSGAGALQVPLSALHAEDGRPALWVFDPATGTVRLRAVEIGPYTEDSVPVLSGVAASDWVVAAGVHLLRDGQPIVPIDRDNRRLDLAAAR